MYVRQTKYTDANERVSNFALENIYLSVGLFGR